jgi:hypothetical protein
MQELPQDGHRAIAVEPQIGRLRRIASGFIGDPGFEIEQCYLESNHA